MTLPPLSLYIHVPWCVRKCPYCDFNSHEKRGELPETAYIAALLEDLDCDLGFIQDRPLQSIFIGGGTPSLFGVDSYARLLGGLRDRLNFAGDIEITLEANPGTLERGRFEGYRDLGINRLSIGVQSFEPEQLHKLGRIHSDKDAIHAIESAQAAGFDNFNIDLMHGLSGQNQNSALRDIDIALAAGAPHISWYQLTIEANTEFYKRPPSLPIETTLEAIQRAGLAQLVDAGMARYEVSAFALPGREARHNLNYWQFGDYLALGAGAHGKISLADGEIFRYQKTRKPEDYLQREGCRSSKRERIKPEDLPLEFMINALRLRRGFSGALFERHTGQSLAGIRPQLTQLCEQGLLEQHGDHYRASERGYDLLDSILDAFLVST